MVPKLQHWARPRRPLALLALVLAACLGHALPARAQLAGQSVKGFRLPEYTTDGRLKHELYGETATLLEGGLMQLSGLRIEFFDSKGLVARVMAPECAFDQVARRAASRSHIRIVTDRGIITGDGFAWNGQNEQFQIFENVRVVLDPNTPELEKSLGAPAGAASPAPAAVPSASEPAPKESAP